MSNLRSPALRLLIPSLAALAPVAKGGFEPVLSEIMASSDSVYADEDGEFSDWIEIQNIGDIAGTLAGWFLTDDIGSPTRWQFPDTPLAPGEFVVVFASDKDRAAAGEELHTNFKLTAGGEYLALIRVDGVTAASEFAPAFPEQVTDVSYGRDSVTGASVYFAAPTPNSSNSPPLFVAGPRIANVTQDVPLLNQGEDLVISADISPAEDRLLSSAEMHYRINYSSEVAVAMLDDGLAPDLVAGDGTFTATIPASAISTRAMVRWAVFATDSEGGESSQPLRLDPLAAEWFGTAVDDGVTTSGVRRFRWWVRNRRWYYTNGSVPIHKDYTSCSVLFDGEFYDNVRVRVRGASSVHLDAPVQSFHFNFHGAHRFRLLPGAKRVDRVNLNWMFVDQVYLRNHLSMEAFAVAGAPTPASEMVIGYQNGLYLSVGNIVEHPDEKFLERQGLDPNGALYKVYNRLVNANNRPEWTPGTSPNALVGVEKKTRLHENNADLAAFINGINSSNPDRFLFAMDNLDLPAVLNYMAAGVIDCAHDVFEKNNFVYRDSDGSGEWLVVPWDRDVSWGQGVWNQNPIEWSHPSRSHPHYGSGVNGAATKDRFEIFEAIIDEPVLREMFERRLRTVLDEQLQAPGTPPDELLIEARLAELIASLDRIDPPGSEADNWIQRDKDRFGKLRGSPGQSGYSATTALQTLDVAAAAVRDTYLPNRRIYLYDTMGPSGAGIVPAAQSRNPAITIGAVDYNPSSANQDEEFVEIVNPNAFAVDISGWTISGGIEHTFKPGTVLPASGAPSNPDRGKLYLSPDVAAFRARGVSPTGGEERFVQGNYAGHLSNFGETLELRAGDGALMYSTTTPVDPSLSQQFLVISEVMYHPLGDGLAEYVELMNIGPNQLDLSGVKFSEGVEFSFAGSAMTALASGAKVLVVRDLAAFESVHGGGLPVAGEFANDRVFENAGETIKLEDASNSTIAEFRYRNTVPWPTDADGLGYSLVLIDPASRPDPSLAASWRSSAARGGSPGGGDASSFAGDPMADTNGDGIVDFLHYATIGDLQLYRSPEAGVVSVSAEDGSATSFGSLSFVRNLAADDVVHEVEASLDLQSWESGEMSVLLYSEVNNGDGTSTVVYRSTIPVSDLAQLYFRLRVKDRQGASGN